MARDILYKITLNKDYEHEWHILLHTCRSGKVWKVSRLNRVIAINGGQTSLVNVDLTGKILLEKGLQTVIVSTYPSVNGKIN